MVIDVYICSVSLDLGVQQLRDTQEGDFEPGSGPPPVPALDDLDGAIFREPPPPYS